MLEDVYLVLDVLDVPPMLEDGPFLLEDIPPKYLVPCVLDGPLVLHGVRRHWESKAREGISRQ